MLKKYKREFFLLGVFTLISYLFVLPKLLRDGTNIVTLTYQLGSTRLIRGELPYIFPLPGADWFKYSPLFAVLYYPLTLLPNTLHSCLWGFINILLFWMGIVPWLSNLSLSSMAVTASLIACSMELNGSILYQQINAGLIGLTLLALFLFRRRNNFIAGTLIAFVSNIKLLPILFGLTLSITLRPMFLLGLFISSLCTLLIPALQVGFNHNLSLHLEWFKVIMKDLNGTGILDISSVFHYLGWTSTGQALRLIILFATLATMVIMIQYSQIMNWSLWISLGLSGLLLVSPRTENPTFVFIGPSYILLSSYILKEVSQKRALWWALLWLSIFFITISYNDIWPKWLYNPHKETSISKSLGTLTLWCISEVFIWTQVVKVLKKIIPLKLKLESY